MKWATIHTMMDERAKNEPKIESPKDALNVARGIIIGVSVTLGATALVGLIMLAVRFWRG